MENTEYYNESFSDNVLHFRYIEYPNKQMNYKEVIL